MKAQIQEQSELSQQQLIRRNGYELTVPAKFILPTASNPTSLIHSLFQFFSNNDKQIALFDPHTPKSLTVLNQKLAVLYHSNKITVIRVAATEEGLTVQSRASFLLNERIKRVVCGYYGYKQEKSEPFHHFAVQYELSSTISLFRVDHQAVTLIQETRESQKIMAMRFTSNSESVILLNNGKVSSYSIRQGKLIKSKVSLKILLEDDHTLSNGQICTTGSNNQLKILLFYLIHSKKHQKYQLHLKEYSRDSLGNLQQLATYYDIFQTQNIHTLAQSMFIYCFGESVFIHQGLNLNVLQKRFGKYARSDVISQLSSALRVTLIQSGQHIFLCSFGEGEIELWQVVMKDVGCTLQLLDVIEANGVTLAQKYIKSWIFVQNKKPQFVLAFDDGPRQVDLFLTKKMDKLSKLTKRVRREELRLEGGPQKTQKCAFSSRLRQMQQLGGKLGFRRKEFYLKLWHQSEKNSAHIVEFLLACKDFKVIFNELTQFLRVKKLTVTETIRILKRIEQSLLEELTHSLELELIRQFLKTNFQRRKLKLYSGEVQLDLQQYQDIYDASLFDLVQRSIDLRLFPEKFKHDIVWKEQTQEKPIEITYILREFRLIILQDYPRFLLRLLQPYGAHLKQVVETYPYLLPQFPLKISMVREQLVMLSNIYEDEKIEEQQYSWLGYIRQNQWQREASSLDFLHKHLINHHSTSLITDKLRQFTEGTLCRRDKYSRHVLLQTRRKEFQAKLPAISDGSSLLFLCEWANRLALQSGGRSDSEAIVEAMHKHNNLPMQEYQHYRLFCALHHQVIKERLIHPSTTVMELMELPPQKLVACFFLGDRQRIAFLFKEVSKLYSSREAFNKIVESFVNSGQCSKVELQMLTNYLRRSGEHYQQENQQLISIVLRGFLKRIEVREKDKALDFINLFRSISLAQPLIITLALFETVKVDCITIFKLFQLSSLTYDTLINDPRTVITSIVHQFFSNPSIRMKSLYIQGREVSLSFARNLFVVVLYLKDKMYSYGQEMELYMIFCETVLGWNQFDLIRQCFGGDITIDQQQYLPQEFAAIIVDYMLNKYYEDETLLYCQETNEHINRMLTLIDETAQTAVIQKAKMEFVALLQPLGHSISVQYIQLVRQQWEKDEQRNGLFKDVVDLFPQVDFQLAIDLYHALQRMRTGNSRVQVKTDEFVQLALYICSKYVKTEQFERICEVISFLNAGELYYRAKYSFMIECFIQVMHDRVQMPHHLRQSFFKVDKSVELAYCKSLIDYFLTHFEQVDLITQFFASRFELPQGQISDFIQIDRSLCFGLNQTQGLSRKEVWDSIVSLVISGSESFSRSQIGKKSKNNPGSNALDTKTILFAYYFICNIMHNSHYLFELDDISYQHVENVHLLAQLAKKETFRTAINFKSIYRQYLKGLFKIYVLLSQTENEQVDDSIPVMEKRISMDADMKITEIRNMDDSKLTLIVTDVPCGHQKNEELTRAMKRLVVLFQNAYIPPQQKQKSRLPKVKTVVQHEQPSLPLYFQPQHGNLKQSMTQLPLGHSQQQKKTYRFVQFQKMKKQVASKSNMVSEKLLIGKVLDQLQISMNARQQTPSESIIQQKLTIHRLMGPQNDSADEEDIGNVLQEINMESNQMIALDLSGIHSLLPDSAQMEQIKQLIQAKQYEKITMKFQIKTILKALDTEFYKKSQALTRPKKRIARSNTLKETTLSSKLITLLETLDGLKLYGNNTKARLLRSCLTTISSEELQSIQTNLLGVFTLKVLVENSKDVPNLSKMVLKNAKEICMDLQLQKFKLAIRVIQSFMNKCKEQSKTSKHSQRHISQPQEAADMYYEYIVKLNNSSKPEKDKQAQLTQIMTLLQKDNLLAIHQRLSQALSNGDLYIAYLQLIHKLYVDEG